jgi:hypothetical protein
MTGTDGACPNCGGTMLAEDGCPWCGPEPATIPAPPPGDPDPAEMVKAELELLRLERDTAIASARSLNREIKRQQRQIHDLHKELDQLKGRRGHF